MALIRKQRVLGLPLQSELVVVAIPFRPNGPVIECRVPNTRAPMPPMYPPRRPVIRRPLFNPTIPRLDGPRNNTAPQPVAPVQPLRPGSWIERVSVEGELVLCSHHTGPGGSLKWTVQYFPRHEHSYYLSQYPTYSSFDPLFQLLLGARPLIIKVPGEIMKELCEFVFSEFKVEGEFDATSIPLPPSRHENLLPDLSWASNTY
ncbi:hypothetical protein FS837_000723 [Tulasnella sp. UAMH 9824]|nr:hypothetical protein FS837_000723 [Tulasnella sp. UAMH 9824]